jgi:hypothetical protein
MVMVTLLGESRYNVNGTLVAALQRLGIAGYSASCMDLPLPCTTTSALFTLSN